MKIEKIWSTPAYLADVQDTLTDEILSEAEEKLGVKLPLEYVELLRNQNGGYIRYNLEDCCHEMIFGIGDKLPTITNTYLDEYGDDLSFPVRGLVPFDGDGHWNICFDYREVKQDPPIVYVSTESDYDEVLADSFAEYLKQLKIEFEEGTYVVDTSLSLQEIVEVFENELKIKGEIKGCDEYGYDSYLGLSSDRTNGVTIEPNRVCVSFMRPTEEGYEGKKHLMNEMNVQHPELPVTCYFIGVTPELEEALFKLCEKERFVCEPVEMLMDCRIVSC